MNKIPHIVCLCGSTRFHETFDKESLRLALEGKIVLSIGSHLESDDEIDLSIEQMIGLSRLHLRKIDLCDSVFIINKDGYIGNGTRKEINYAHSIGKPVEYLDAPTVEAIEDSRYNQLHGKNKQQEILG